MFSEIFRTRRYAGRQSVSGTGSEAAQAAAIRNFLPKLVQKLQIKSILDAGCGDLYWLKDLPLEVAYVGVDVVPEIVEANRKAFGGTRREFLAADVTRDPLPKADLVLCRDCLVHLSFEDALSAIRNIRASGAGYLAATTFPGRANKDVETGGWRPLDLSAPPFDFPAPIELLNEANTENGGRWADKSLGVWKL